MIDFEIERSDLIEGLILIHQNSFEDTRGEVWSTFSGNDLSEDLPDGLLFNHDKFAINKLNILRGIHGDSKSWKLVTCLQGKIFQVCVDLRPDSKTFRKHQTFYFEPSEKKFSVLMPPNFGNAFLSLTDDSIYHYKLAYEGAYFDAEDQFTYKWNDPDINIEWPIDNPTLSVRDK